MGFARVRATAEQLQQALGLPADARIVDADMHKSGDDVMLTVEHRDLKATGGEARPVLSTFEPKYFLSWDQEGT